MRPRVLLLSGATASGKTDLVLELARSWPIDVISADAAQVFRGLDIGTAKPSPEVLARVPHRLIDIREPTGSYSAAEFRVDALREIERSLAAGRIPVVTGGTMFYLSALIHGLSDLPAASSEVRRGIEIRAAREGWEALREDLLEYDPVLADRVRRGDRQRLSRLLELREITGRRPSEVLASSPPRPLPYRHLHLALFHPDRQVLHQRIRRRFEGMLEAGFEDEVRRLRSLPGLSAESVSIRTVGYRQLWRYLEGVIDRNSMIEAAVAATRQLAKRQLTWLRAMPGLVWCPAADPAAAASFLAQAGLPFVNVAKLCSRGGGL